MDRARCRTLQVVDTELYADAVEWCPYEGLQDVLLCGTYQLVEEGEEMSNPQVRVGQLQVYRLRGPRDMNTTSLPSLTRTQCLSMPGVLDIKWSRQKLHDTALCGLVNAQGDLQLWRFQDSNEQTNCRAVVEGKICLDDTRATEKEEYETSIGTEMFHLECLQKINIGQCIGLSLDWAAPTERSSARVVTSDSTGSLTVFDVNSSVTKSLQWVGHDFEAWICAFDHWNSEVIYSGSDDCKLKTWDLRVGSTPVGTNSRFTMGVCSIQSNPHRENLLSVGSYDEILRLFDSRQMREPLSTICLNGGIWRVKWDPFSGSRILTATMHNGFHIIDFSNTGQDPIPVTHYSNQSSLAYGADWCRLGMPLPPLTPSQAQATTGVFTPISTPPEGLNTGQPLQESGAATRCCDCVALIASCSFYDHNLQLWDVQL